jgi:autotransporter-associated beta strand protein
VTGDPTFYVNGASSITGPTGNGDVVVLGTTNAATDVLTITSSSSYVGTTQVGDGTTGVTLKAGAGGAFDNTSAFTVNTNAVLDLNGINQTIGSLTGTGTVESNNGAATLTTGGDNSSLTIFSGNLIDGGGTLGLTKSGSGAFALSGDNTYSGATTVSSGALAAASTTAFSTNSAFTVNATLDLNGYNQTIGSLAGNGIVTNTGGTTATLTTGGNNAPTTTFSGNLINGTSALGLTKSGSGIFILSGNNTYSGTTTVSAGTLQAGSTTAFSTTSAFVVNATLDLGGFNQTLTSLAGSNSGIVTNSGGSAVTLTVGDTTSTGYYGQIVDGTGGIALTKVGNGTLTLFGNNTYSGATTITAGTLALSGSGSIASSSGVADAGTFDISGTTSGASIKTLSGAGNVTLGTQTLTLSNASSTFSGDIGGTGGLTLTTGTEILSGINDYSGATAINGGTLVVNGSIANSTSVTVASGATLTGTGTVDPIAATTTIQSGGTLVPGVAGTPGTSMTIAGNLAFQSGALYVISLNPTTANFTTVTGTATLGGATVDATFANGAYVAKQYTIITAGSVSGNFAVAVDTNLPAGFHTTLTTDATHAYLNLALNFVPPPGAGIGGNQSNAGNAIINYFNTNGSIPLVFGGLTASGLTQISGEAGTGSQQTIFNAAGQFLGVMTDPFTGAGNDAGNGGGSGASGNADDALGYAAKRNPSDALAAIYTKAAPRRDTFAARWSTWAAGFGGSETTNGNAIAATNSATSRVYGTALGASYRFTPDTSAGFSLAGGGTNFSVANGGTGRSDFFQAGAFVRQEQGPAYINAALAYGWQQINTTRFVTVAGLDQLRARFNANAYSGRIESGYRFIAPVIGGIGVTPYAAGQFTTVVLPSYMESAFSGLNTFALAYSAKTVTDPRSEVGFRTDKSFALTDAILTLRGRAAWAHDSNTGRAIGATFETLPGATFVVNGAAPAHDSALVSASAEMKWTNNWSVAATLDSEFSSVTQSFAGKGVVRYAW